MYQTYEKPGEREKKCVHRVAEVFFCRNVTHMLFFLDPNQQVKRLFQKYV